jgi:hypothetical protein
MNSINNQLKNHAHNLIQNKSNKPITQINNLDPLSIN